jgi:hypothetical protein
LRAWGFFFVEVSPSSLGVEKLNLAASKWPGAEGKGEGVNRVDPLTGTASCAIDSPKPSRSRTLTIAENLFIFEAPTAV